MLETFFGLHKQQAQEFLIWDGEAIWHSGLWLSELGDPVRQGELEEWQCTLRFPDGESRILCNAEDRRWNCEGDAWGDGVADGRGARISGRPGSFGADRHSRRMGRS